MAEYNKNYDFARDNSPLTGLDLKRVIDAYNLWKARLVPGQEILFDLGGDNYVTVFSDKIIGCPDVRVWWEDEEVEVNPDELLEGIG